MTEHITMNEWLGTKRGFAEGLNIPIGLIPDTADISMMLKLRYGDKLVHNIFNDLSGAEVANYLNNVYNSKWEWLVEFVAENYGIGEVNKKTITEQFNNEVTGKQNGNVTNKESAYNTDEFVNSDSQENTANSEGTNSGDRTREETYSSYYTALQQLNTIDKQNVVHLILDDIVNEICLKIY